MRRSLRRLQRNQMSRRRGMRMMRRSVSVRRRSSSRMTKKAFEEGEGGEEEG